MQKFTPPKFKKSYGNFAVLPTVISADAEFTVAAETFCEYAAKNGVLFSNGEGGIRVKRDSTLEKEGFCIEITDKGAEILAADIKGAHGALSILASQIETAEGGFTAEQMIIKEAPDMYYRGLSVDLARQWHAPEYIIKYIDLCYFNRATHLQLHFTDDQSFTLPIDSFPKLSTEGRTYKKKDIAEVRITFY